MNKTNTKTCIQTSVTNNYKYRIRANTK